MRVKPAVNMSGPAVLRNALYDSIEVHAHASDVKGAMMLQTLEEQPVSIARWLLVSCPLLL